MNVSNELSGGIKAAVSIIGGGFAAWFGGVWPMLVMVFGFLVFDYVTGMLAAGKAGKINSKAGTQGIWKKLATLLLMVLGLAMDAAIPWFVSRGMDIDLGVKLPFGLVICAWICINEIVSITENLVECGVKVPAFLVKALKITADQINGDTTDD